MKLKLISLSLLFIFLAFSSIAHALDNDELSFGYSTDRLFITSQTILFNDAVNKRINEIGNRIATASGGPHKKYTFRVINNPTINAYSAAGGFVYINTGLLDVLESEDELASIIAHEIAHTNNSHQINCIYQINRSIGRGRVVSALIEAGMIVAVGLAYVNNVDGEYVNKDYLDPLLENTRILGKAVGNLVGDLMIMSMITGYGKKQELEADKLAVQYTKRAGYDPNALISVLKKLVSIRDRLGLNGRNYVSSLINAEPGLEERIKNAEELILNPNKNKQSTEE